MKIVYFGIILVLSGCSILDTNANQSINYEQKFKDLSEYVPTGYRIPVGTDLDYWGTDKNTYFYKTKDGDGNLKAPFWTKGDFNQDGFDDWVYILFRSNDDKADVFSFLSISPTKYIPKKIISVNKFMGVSTTVSQFNNKLNLLKIFEFEGHGFLYRWDNGINAFVRENPENIH